MKLNIFKSYYDSTPVEITLDEIVQLIKSDESLRSLTEKHRYYRSLNLKNEAQTMKASCGCFAVAARFDKGKDMKNITELTFIGMAEADHVEPQLIPELRQKAREDPHTLLEYVSIGQEGFHVLYRYVITNLSDPTDNRRWLVVKVLDIDNPLKNPFNYTGIYSQALALWKSGYRYWFDQEEIRALNEQNQEFQVPSPEEELLLTYFRPTFEGCQGSVFMKVSEILERINVGIKQPLSPNKLGMLLTKLGFKKARYNNERGYLLIERSVDEINTTRKLAAQRLQS